MIRHHAQLQEMCAAMEPLVIAAESLNAAEGIVPHVVLRPGQW